MDILVTGGTGYIGRRIINLLLQKKDINLYVLVREKTNLELLDSFKNRVTLVNDINISLLSMDLIIHTATCYGRKGESLDEIFKSNVTWPLSVINQVRKETTILYNFDTSLAQDVSNYSFSKHKFVEEIRKIGIKVINLKIEQFFGPHDNTFFSFIVNSFLNNKDKIELTEGEQLRDFIFVDDLLGAFDVIFSNSNEDFKFLEFEIGSGEALSIRQFVHYVSENFPESTTVLNWGVLPYRDKEQMKSVANVATLRKLGWHPTVSTKEAVKDSIETMRSTKPEKNYN